VGAVKSRVETCSGRVCVHEKRTLNVVRESPCRHEIAVRFALLGSQEMQKDGWSLSAAAVLKGCWHVGHAGHVGHVGCAAFRSMSSHQTKSRCGRRRSRCIARNSDRDRGGQGLESLLLLLLLLQFLAPCFDALCNHLVRNEGPAELLEHDGSALVFAVKLVPRHALAVGRKRGGKDA
jgi:hypothetical protein